MFSLENFIVATGAAVAAGIILWILRHFWKTFRDWLDKAWVSGAVAGIMAGAFVVIALGGALQGQAGAPDPQSEPGPPGSIEFPVGMVAAFDSYNGCPPGWRWLESARGRFIVGVGGGEGLVARAFHESGGNDQVTLTIDELPRHTHAGERPFWVVGADSGAQGFNGDGSSVVSSGILPDDGRAIQYAGGGQEFPIMPPYIALYWCTPDRSSS